VIVVSDTTAVTSLLKIGRAALLKELFAEVCIPNAVRDELLSFHRAIPEFLNIRVAQNQSAVELLLAELDRGEAEAIVLAQEISADALLIDEKLGRKIAESRGLQCLGLAGALLLAKQNGIIPSLGSILDELESHANFFLDETVKSSLIRRAQE
jgi:predicted nucleic acid-binding protein